MANMDHVRLILAGRKSVNKWLEDNGNEILDLSYYDFSTIKKLANIDFSLANLRKSIFDSVELTSCHFEKANLRGASFSGSKLINCVFTGSNLRKSVFSFANIRDSKLDSCCMKSSKFNRCEFYRANMSNSDLSYSYIWLASIKYSNFSGCDLSHSDLMGLADNNSDFHGCDITQSYMPGTQFTNSNLEDANFSHSNLTESFLHGILNYTNLSNCNLTRCRLQSDVNDCDFSGSNLTDVSFSERVENSDFSNLSNITFASGRILFGSENKGVVVIRTRTEGLDFKKLLDYIDSKVFEKHKKLIIDDETAIKTFSRHIGLNLSSSTDHIIHQWKGTQGHYGIERTTVYSAEGLYYLIWFRYQLSKNGLLKNNSIYSNPLELGLEI